MRQADFDEFEGKAEKILIQNFVDFCRTNDRKVVGSRSRPRSRARTRSGTKTEFKGGIKSGIKIKIKSRIKIKIKVSGCGLVARAKSFLGLGFAMVKKKNCIKIIQKIYIKKLGGCKVAGIFSASLPCDRRVFLYICFNTFFYHSKA